MNAATTAGAGFEDLSPVPAADPPAGKVKNVADLMDAPVGVFGPAGACSASW